MEYFTSQKLNHAITKIMTPYGVWMYLIEGKKRAALIDTGYGVGDLKSYIDSLTHLPYFVICTHGHVDHASGTGQFDKVYLNPKDFELERRHTIANTRKQFALNLSGIEPAENDLISQRTQPYLPLRDGMVFDLGSLTLEAIEVSGHTPGCTCILIEEMRLLILGDACNSRSFMFFPEATKISNLLKSLKKLNSYTDKFDHVIFFHPDNIGDKNNIIEGIELCQEILDGTDDHLSANLLNTDLFIAKKIHPDWHRVDGKMCNIYYTSDKI